jgi:hypothetical protein
MAKSLLFNDFFQWFLFPHGALDEVVEVGDIGLMMFSVMVLERLRGKLVGKVFDIVG